MDKPGYQTSEFWVTLAVVVGCFTLAALGKLTTEAAIALLPAALAAVGYSHGRATVKAAE